jgi:hypothetical protein
MLNLDTESGRSGKAGHDTYGSDNWNRFRCDVVRVNANVSVEGPGATKAPRREGS